MRTRGCAVALVVGLVPWLLGSGCEKVATTGVLEVTPPVSQLVEGQAVRLTVALPESERESRNLYYPLQWSLDDPGLGSLVEVGGNAAVYEAGPLEGVNIVTVRDKFGAAGSAVITQTEAP